MTAGRRLFRVLLLVLPRSWRRRWERETLDAFATHLEDARASGRLALARVWLRGVWDIVRWSVTLRLPHRTRAPRTEHLRFSWIASDLRYAWRVYRRRPLQTMVMVFTMAGAIGVCAIVFSAVNSILLRPLPFPNPDRLVTILQRYPNSTSFGTLSWANFADLRTAVPAFASAGVAVGTRNAVSISGFDPFYAETYHVSENFHAVGGVDPILGRLPRLATDGPLESLIGEELWAREFGRDHAVLGRAVEVNNSSSVIVGVLPAGAGLPRGTDIWTVMDLESWWGSGRTLGGLNGFARLRAGATIEMARAQANTLAAAIRAEYGSEVGAEFQFQIAGLHEDLTRTARETLVLLACAVGAVFLITCINIAGIATTQFMVRRRELAVRSSLGAGRERIAWQLLTESVLLAAASAILGVAVAWVGSGSLNQLLPESYLRSGPVRPDWRVVAMGVGLAVTAGLLTAAIPIRRAWRGPDFQTLRATGGHDRSRDGAGLSSHALLVPQYAISLATLAITGLLIRTMLSLGEVDPGFTTAGRIALETDVPSQHVSRSASYQRELADAVAAVPGVTGVAFAYSLPIMQTSSVAIELQTDRDAPDIYPVNALWRTVSPSYFEVMGIPLLVGRTFPDTERHEPSGVVISRTLAERLGGVEAAPQIRLRPRLPSMAGSIEGEWLEVIGVVGDLRDRGIRADPWPVVYVVNSRNPNWARYADMVVRLDRSPEAAAPEIVAVARAFDAQLPIGRLRTFDEVVDANLHPQRFRATVLSGFGIAALALVTLGMYGATAQTVQRRRRELAIRAALGAAPAMLIALSIRDVVSTVIMGTVIGLGITWVGARLVQNMLFGVQALDPAAIGAAFTIVAVAGLAAAWLPSRQATRIDPTTILRQD